MSAHEPITTARILAAAIQRRGFDLVIAGTESTDGYTGVVPQQMSELLDVPSLTFARKVEVSDGRVKIERQTAAGYDVVEAPTPALLAVTAGVVEPRYPTFKGIMAAKSKPVEKLTAADLGVDPVVEQRITEVRPAPERAGGEIIEDDGEAHLRIIQVLEQAKVI